MSRPAPGALGRWLQFLGLVWGTPASVTVMGQRAAMHEGVRAAVLDAQQRRAAAAGPETPIEQRSNIDDRNV